MLQLNFAVEEAEVDRQKQKPRIKDIQRNLKKGSWRQKRQTAKIIVHAIKKKYEKEDDGKGTGSDVGNGKDDGEGAANNSVDSSVVNHDTLKRRAKPSSAPQSSLSKSKLSASSNSQATGFSSSIFTANPSQKATPAPAETAQHENINNGGFVFSDSSFPGLGIHSILAMHLEKLKVTTPTPIQKAAIPKLNLIKDRDIIIQAQTGSGKTFAFLLPILHNLITAASTLESVHGPEYFSRNTGAFAIVLVPTRELAQQIATVLESLLKYTRNSSSQTESEQDEKTGCKHWIVSGLITGGESKKSEKARLRKGINILVATPGRLLDHLKTTEAFQVGNVRWLVLDEADNLLHLGFEEALREILFILNEKGLEAVKNEKRAKIENWPFERQTILCSATIEGGVEKLAQQELRNPIFVKSSDGNSPSSAHNTTGKKDVRAGSSTENDTKDVVVIPEQMKQLYVLSPAKLRMVNLIGLIRKVTESGKTPCKIIVFLATGDSVDWHFDALYRGAELDKIEDKEIKSVNEGDEKEEIDLSQSRNEMGENLDPIVYNDLPKLRAGYQGKFLENCRLFKLHGSMQQSERHAVYTGFSPTLTTSTSSVMFCTDVAARGLDLPDVSHVIQYDPPADVRDYIHRIGRTARLGKEGQAFIFLLPSEVEYLDLLEDYKCSVREQPSVELLKALVPLAAKPATKKLKHQIYEVAATDVHMSIERFVQSSKRNLMHAQKAFSSFVRAYTTHLSSEKHIFHIKKLHLGHLAKSFCLQEAPAILQSKFGNLAKSLKDQKEKNGSGGGVTAASMKRKALMMAKSMMVSEFSAGTFEQTAQKKSKIATSSLK